MICTFLLACTLTSCHSLSNGTDLYNSFSELFQAENKTHYKIESKQRKSEVLVLAPHGGAIEFGTSELAQSLAGNNWSYYSFKGLLRNNNRRLHITSSNFDEPVALAMAKKNQICLAIHGYASTKNDAHICFGGRNKELMHRLQVKLRERGIQNVDNINHCGKYFGHAVSNIVNRCALEGVQMELSGTFREMLLKDEKLRNKFESAVQETVNAYLKAAGR